MISFQKKAEQNKFQTRMWPYYGRKNRGHTTHTGKLWLLEESNEEHPHASNSISRSSGAR